MKQPFLYISLFALCACSGSEENIIPDEQQNDMSISFAMAEQSEGEVITRSSTMPLERDFVVFGMKSVNGTTQKVFDGYKVKYEGKDMTGITPYSYVGGTSISGDTQGPKYWDYSAAEYRFWATTGDPTDPNVTFSDYSFSFDIDLSNLTNLPMFSEQNVLYSENFGKMVQMKFMRLYSMVRYKFICTEKDMDPASLNIKNDKFEPAEEDKYIYTSGKINVIYSMVDDITYSVNTAGAQKFLAITPSSEEYTVVMPTPQGQSAFKMTANIQGTDREAIVPSQYMKWMPNTKYTYIFKITDNSITFYDVQIDPWTYGGSQEEEWKNW